METSLASISFVPGSFEAEVRKVLKFLAEKLDFKLWMLTRTEGEDWICVSVVDDEYGIQAGDKFQWAHSFCSRMVRGEGPNIAPDSTKVPVYVEAEINQQAKIKAYVGMPVKLSDGRMFGTLCAIDPEQKDAKIEGELALVEMAAHMLGRLLDEMVLRLEASRAAEKALVESILDSHSGLLNRRGFLRTVENEQSRSAILQAPVSLVVIDLDGLKTINDTEGHEAGDAYILAAADAIRSTLGMFDQAGRLGGDEFGMLLAECNSERAMQVCEALRNALEVRGVQASIGCVTAIAGEDLDKALKEADDLMYADKRQRKQAG